MSHSQQRVQSEITQPVVSRRDLIAGGGALIGGLLLSGCGGSRANGSAPRTWADEDAASYSPAPCDTPACRPDFAAPTYSSSAQAPSTTWPPTPTYQAPAPQRPVQAQAPASVIPRSSWTRQGVARPREIYAIAGINRLTIHHDGMPPAALRSTRDVAMRLEQIRAAHVNGRGWADIGYHYIIDPSGRVWEGRNIYYQGAHVKDQNENNLGVLVLGNFQVQRPSAQALNTLDRFVSVQMQRYNIPLSRVKTHKELAQTDCPGRNLQAYVSSSRGKGNMLAFASAAGLARG